jgi:hypothetical protein
MPYKSDSQRKYFHVMEKKGKISKETVDEFDKSSKGMKLPEYVMNTDHMNKHGYSVQMGRRIK